jgi:hypothetical protein
MWTLRSLVRARIPIFRLWGFRFRYVAALRWELSMLSSIPTFGALRLPLARRPFNMYIFSCYPFALKDRVRLAPMANELVDRLAILVVDRCFSSLGAVDSNSSRYERVCTAVCIYNIRRLGIK